MLSLREYQFKSAYLLCLGKGGFDFSVPGAGKTIIAYTAYAYLKSTDTVSRCFIIGPLSSYNAWVDEYRTCFGRDPDFLSLATEDKSFCKDYLCASVKNHHEISFINIDKIRLLKAEISSFLRAAPTLLIIDEAHKIKSPGAKSTQAAFSFANNAAARILLTGTPMPNGYEDLHALMQVFSPRYSILPFGYAKLKSMTKKGANASELERLRSSIAPYYSRISKKYLIETGELTPAEVKTVFTDLDKNQADLYNRLDSFSRITKNDIDEDLLFAFKKAVLIRKMQISANPMLLKKPIADSMDEYYLQLITDDLSEKLHLSSPQYRIAIIYKRGLIGLPEALAATPSGNFAFGAVDTKKVSVITVEEAKGLEFDAVLVVDNYMSINERYVAYTRALDNLLISTLPNAAFEANEDDSGDDEPAPPADELSTEDYLSNEGSKSEDEVLPQLTNEAVNIPLVEGSLYAKAFFYADPLLSNAFLSLAEYVIESDSDICIRVSSEYIGLAKPEERCRLYVSESGGKMYVRFKHLYAKEDFVAERIDQYKKTYDQCALHVQKYPIPLRKK